IGLSPMMRMTTPPTMNAAMTAINGNRISRPRFTKGFVLGNRGGLSAPTGSTGSGGVRLVMVGVSAGCLDCSVGRNDEGKTAVGAASVFSGADNSAPSARQKLIDSSE